MQSEVAAGPFFPRLMLVWDGSGGRASLNSISHAVTGGLQLLQLRAPSLTDSAQIRLIAELQLRFPALTLLVNRRFAVAREAQVALHLPEAEPLPEGLGPEMIWGRSVHGVDAALAAAQEGAAYLVLGTIFPTPSKPGRPGAGAELIRAVTSLVRAPVFAIGGITPDLAGVAIAAGAHGVAVQRAILDSPNPEGATRLLLRGLGERHEPASRPTPPLR